MKPALLKEESFTTSITIGKILDSLPLKIYGMERVDEY